MARVEMRDCTLQCRDALSGSATINTAVPTANDVTVNIITVNLNTADVDLVPVGARFTVNTANNTTLYTVTGRDPTVNSPTEEITFTPKWGAETPAQNDVITFESCRIDVKVGDGNLTWSEGKEYEYLLDRGNLDSVREGDEQPVDVSMDFVYEFIVTGTNEDITVVDALKQQGAASEWVSTSDDECEPYCIDIVIIHCVPCGTPQDEKVELKMYRYESLEFDLAEASISTSGRCNITEATVTRDNFDECV